jgi:predicted dehydrogenase
MERREFMAAGLGTGLAQNGPVRLGVIGTGNRGTSLLGVALRIPWVEVPALCDTDQANLERAQARVVKAGRAKPEVYSGSPESYRKLLDRKDLDAVIIATPWNWHAPMGVAAMQAGKYTGIEVPAALTVEECWQLLETLENWSFRRDNLAVLNMIRAGLLGQTVHCHCAYSHDCVDHWFFDKSGKPRWSSEFLLKRNADQYPTHGLGPVLSWMDINRGDAFESIASTATGAFGAKSYFTRTLGAEHPAAKLRFKQGDIVTSVIRTKLGKTVVVNNDMQLPRPYDNRWLIQGTLGIYREQPGTVYLEGRSPKYHEWEPFEPYQTQYEHKWWKPVERGAAGSDPLAGGHGGTDDIEIRLFLEAARSRSATPLDLIDGLTMSAVVGMSEASIGKGGAVVAFPDFTRGAWRTKRPYFGV